MVDTLVYPELTSGTGFKRKYGQKACPDFTSENQRKTRSYHLTVPKVKFSLKTIRGPQNERGCPFPEKKLNMINNIVLSITIFLACSTVCQAQSSPAKYNEIGFQVDLLNGIDNASFSFKSELENKRFFRARARRQSYFKTTSSFEELYQVHNDVFSLGVEEQFKLKERISFYAGVDAAFLFDWSNGGPIGQKGKDKSFVLGTGVGLPHGFVFRFSDQLSFQFETIPTLFYRHKFSDGTSDHRLDGDKKFTMDFQGYFIGVAYHWSRK